MKRDKESRRLIIINYKRGGIIPPKKGKGSVYRRRPKHR